MAKKLKTNDHQKAKPSISVRLPDGGQEVSGCDHLEFFLKAGHSAQLFVDYLETEYSVENILFWREIEEFRVKHSKDPSNLDTDARTLFEKYVSVDAPQQINISSVTRDALAEDLAKEPHAKIFDKAQRSVFDLMKNDAFPRFQTKAAEMLSASWLRMCKKGVPAIGYSFYSILFEMAPAAEGLFPGGLKAIKKAGSKNQMLVTMVDTCINLLNDLKSVVSILRNTARRHLKYGVEMEHFTLVGTAFLKMVAKEDSRYWDEKLETAWANLYQIMSGLMILAMTEARGGTAEIEIKTNSTETKNNKKTASPHFLSVTVTTKTERLPGGILERDLPSAPGTPSAGPRDFNFDETVPTTAEGTPSATPGSTPQGASKHRSIDDKEQDEDSELIHRKLTNNLETKQCPYQPDNENQISSSKKKKQKKSSNFLKRLGKEKATVVSAKKQKKKKKKNRKRKNSQEDGKGEEDNDIEMGVDEEPSNCCLVQ